MNSLRGWIRLVSLRSCFLCECTVRVTLRCVAQLPVASRHAALRPIHVTRREKHPGSKSGDFPLSEINSPLKDKSRLGSNPQISRSLLQESGRNGETPPKL